jgi:hypothetical protein
MGWYWAAWILLGFGVPEGYALITKHYEWTLSDTTWRWFDVLPGQTIWQWKAAHLLLLFFMLWLSLHLVFRLFR